jgi:DNA polymerase III subunit epsilon
MKLVAIDFETADRSADSACAIRIVSIEKGKITKKGYQLIRPPRRNFVFSYIHGILWADVEAQPTFIEVWDDFMPFWQDADYFLAHNAPFDRNVLMACCRVPVEDHRRCSLYAPSGSLVRIGIFDLRICQPYVPS